MNGPSSDENENVIDVFVLSKSDTDAPVRPEHLEPKGYRVTLFSDSTNLLETLRYGKPNLLVCDSLSLGQEAYEVCRQIKADPDLWMIPVLVVTSASNLSDLLFVLDSNADNFIASPFDPPYLISLVEGMLTTPVEQPTPEQIKTQFKIQHDDHLFVVTADRRRLLEFLLSSFEIAVNKTSDLSRAGSEIISLSKRLGKAVEHATEQTRIVGVLNGTLQDREETIAKIDAEQKGAARQIAELVREKEFFVAERDENRSRIAALEESNRGLVQDREEAAASHRAEVERQSGQIAALDADLALARSELAATRTNLEQAEGRCRDTEGMLAELVPEKERTDKALRAMTLECEQARNATTAEKNRAHAAEQEAKSLLAAKSEAEADLTRIITELKETAKQQAAELVALRDGRAADQDRINGLEARLSTLISEKETMEAGLKRAAADLQKDLDSTSSRADTAAADLDRKTREASSLEAVLKKEQSELAKATSRAAALEGELFGARSALEAARGEHKEAIASLESALRERDSALAELRGAHDEVRTDLVSHRDDLSLARQDLTLVTEERNTLRARLDALAAQVGDLTAKLQAAAADQAEADKQIRSLSDEHDQLIAALEAERRQRRTRDDELHATALAGEKAGEQLEGARKEQERLEKVLNEERREGEKARAQAEALGREKERLESLLVAERSERKQSLDAHEGRISALSTELAAAMRRAGELEGRISGLEAAKREAESRADAYAAEIDQARTALADEWEDHMTANEQLAAAVREKEQRLAAIPLPAADDSPRGPPAVITRTTVLPVAVQPAPSAVTVVPAEEQSLPAASPADDLFEDVPSAEDAEEELPSVSIVRDTEPQVTLGDYPAGMDAEEPASEEPCRGDTPMAAVAGYNGDDDAGTSLEVGSNDDAEVLSGTVSGSSSRPAAPVPAFSFDRTQWFELLKWAHHSGALSQDQRLQIVRMGRLIQKGRRLTNKQDEQVREILSLVHSLGYRFS